MIRATPGGAAGRIGAAPSAITKLTPGTPAGVSGVESALFAAIGAPGAVPEEVVRFAQALAAVRAAQLAAPAAAPGEEPPATAQDAPQAPNSLLESFHPGPAMFNAPSWLRARLDLAATPDADPVATTTESHDPQPRRTAVPPGLAAFGAPPWLKLPSGAAAPGAAMPQDSSGSSGPRSTAASATTPDPVTAGMSGPERVLATPTLPPEPVFPDARDRAAPTANGAGRNGSRRAASPPLAAGAPTNGADGPMAPAMALAPTSPPPDMAGSALPASRVDLAAGSMPPAGRSRSPLPAAASTHLADSAAASAVSVAPTSPLPGMAGGTRSPSGVEPAAGAPPPAAGSGYAADPAAPSAVSGVPTSPLPDMAGSARLASGVDAAAGSPPPAGRSRTALPAESSAYPIGSSGPPAIGLVPMVPLPGVTASMLPDAEVGFAAGSSAPAVRTRTPLPALEPGRTSTGVVSDAAGRGMRQPAPALDPIPTGAMGSPSTVTIEPAATSIPGLESPVVDAAAPSPSDGGPAARADAAVTGDSSVPGAASASPTGVDPASVPAFGPAAADRASPPEVRAIPVDVGAPHWPKAVAAELVMLGHQKVESATLRLSPEHLGPVEVHIHLDAKVINLTFGAAHAETRSALEHALPQLRDGFAQAGLTLGQATVQQQMRQESQNDTVVHHTDSGVPDEVLPKSEQRQSLSLVDEYA